MKSIVLSPAQESIIRGICKVEIEVIEELLTNREIDDEHKFILQAYHAPEAEYFNSLIEFLKEFYLTHKDPNYLFDSMSPECLTIFRVLFFEQWDELRETKPNATLRLFQHLEIQHNISEIEKLIQS